VTKVCAGLGKLGISLIFGWQMLAGNFVLAQAAAAKQAGPAEALYLQLSNVGLDPTRVFRVRNGSVDRPSIHITLEDGTIAFTQDVMGRITGAFFEGEGEVLIAPPNEMERRSMSLFTGMAILEERFSTAYLRFQDDTATELQPSLRSPEDALAFVARWDAPARILAQSDAMRLLETFSEMLPADGTVDSKPPGSSRDRMLHARLQGGTLGMFDVRFDSAAEEQVEAGQSKAAEDGTIYYDVWTSFRIEDSGERPGVDARKSPHIKANAGAEKANADNELRWRPAIVRDYVIDAKVNPPKELDAAVKMQVEFSGAGRRFLAFELSRFLKIQSVEWDGQPVEFIQNPAMEGTRLARSGNDLVAVVLPEAPRKGQLIQLRFVYGGEVLAEAGKGLLYVGARGTWYPNLGLSMANFDMTFRYPQGWTLLATGKAQAAAPASRASVGQATDQEQETRWVSERPIPVAGFDLGKYVRAATKAGEVSVEAYGTSVVEKDFPQLQQRLDLPAVHPSETHGLPPVTTAARPSPGRNAMAVAETAARAIREYSDKYGPYPYSSLALTQLPGRESQGWPGLVFLSSYAFLTSEEQHELHMNAVRELQVKQIPAHEAAHQWWGDLVTWSTYRDQWFSEGLANYCALMILEEHDPAGFRQVMERYRQNLVEKDKDGNVPKDAGPVTLGARLLSSHFPGGYEAISYGRATWLFHMLRSMMQDGAAESARKGATGAAGQEPFVRSLRKVRERYAGKAITTSELFSVFAEDLPPSVWYEGKPSLEWFVEKWVNGTSLPRLELQAVKFSPQENGVRVSGVIRQRDTDENLITSVPVYAVMPGKNPVLLGRVFADAAETPFHLTAPAGTHRLLLDPNQTVLTSPK
jgi:hypothetical protein